VVVTESDARPFGQRISVGGHDLAADEPAAIGGADSGPTPYDLLLAGLGACTSITVRMYAERKGWPLRLVTVRLRHQRIHAIDCVGRETQTGRLDHIEREVLVSTTQDGSGVLRPGLRGARVVRPSEPRGRQEGAAPGRGRPARSGGAS
jgi:uncharacterized OsmC-like protein